MKKIFAVFLVSTLFLTGCTFNQNKNEKYEKVMEEYGMDYYEKYQKGIRGIDEFKITLADLKNANEQQVTNYDLEKINKCKDDSVIEIKVDDTDGSVKSFKITMNC